MYQKYVKRLLDIGLSSAGIVVLSPVLLGLSAAIKADSKGPVLFKQKRIGQNKKYFNILKYRSMAMDTPKDIPTHKLTNPHQ
ncbi:MAG: sugar transferase, partial [Eubacteriaceae bacterium]|nr:sugar transferase [Eubacteriaceae bacterium]